MTALPPRSPAISERGDDRAPLRVEAARDTVALGDDPLVGQVARVERQLPAGEIVPDQRIELGVARQAQRVLVVAEARADIA